MKSVFLSFFSLILALSLVEASPLHPQGGAKITKNEAEHIALKRHQGARVTAAKLETVEGKLVWSIAITQGEHPSMIVVDAMSGRIVSGK